MLKLSIETSNLSIESTNAKFVSHPSVKWDMAIAPVGIRCNLNLLTCRSQSVYLLTPLSPSAVVSHLKSFICPLPALKRNPRFCKMALFFYSTLIVVTSFPFDFGHAPQENNFLY